jgi:quinoprotein glucose dehydrogenase
VFRAHDKTTGDIIAEIALPASQTGLPMTYIHQGKQYIVLAVSGNGPTEIIALALPDWIAGSSHLDIPIVFCYTCRVSKINRF